MTRLFYLPEKRYRLDLRYFESSEYNFGVVLMPKCASTTLRWVLYRNEFKRHLTFPEQNFKHTIYSVVREPVDRFISAVIYYGMYRYRAHKMSTDLDLLTGILTTEQFVDRIMPQIINILDSDVSIAVKRYKLIFDQHFESQTNYYNRYPVTHFITIGRLDEFINTVLIDRYGLEIPHDARMNEARKDESSTKQIKEMLRPYHDTIRRLYYDDALLYEKVDNANKLIVSADEIFV